MHDEVEGSITLVGQNTEPLFHQTRRLTIVRAVTAPGISGEVAASMVVPAIVTDAGDRAA
jgi:hypothetical protein